ncbi:MAG: DUF1501 domain-containing protein [Saprospiraceae bacterium]|nr:DUF1501 domain-containing protein [Saprospiraceae bacterium]MBK9728674.1 DUF1501 domain-containing protein [Saprospiraceae bacterium]
MKRRTFLQVSSLATVPMLINGIPVSAVARNSFLDFVSPENDKILVLIQMTGGNDGLNMVLPLDQYSNLAIARSKIMIKESLGLKLRDDLALHPSMTSLKSLFDAAKVKLIQSVGYPNQNRSHFRSTDIWTSGSSAEQVETTGWLGRYYVQNHADYPTGYPSAQVPDPLAITIGSLVSQTCQGPIANFSLAINDPATLAQIAEPAFPSSIPATNYGNELKYLMETLKQTNDYTDVIKDAFTNAGGTIATTGNRLLDQLNIVAQLIKGGMKTKVYVVQVGGFDTHANQCDPADHEIGVHADLLKQVSDAIAGFQTEIEKSGNQKRVLGMTFSEFGRRIKANDSTGCDHGSAAPMFLFGNCVNPGILGNNPTINASVTNDEGVAMQYDFRSVYASILIDWFEVEPAVVSQILFKDFQKLPVIEGCSPTSVSDYDRDFALSFEAYPNPAQESTQIKFESNDEYIRVTVFDSIGSEIKVLQSGRMLRGAHVIDMDLSDLQSGNYFIRIASESAQKTKALIKL